jgi:hypothetical protein
MFGSSDMIAAEMEEVVDLIVGGEEPLRLAGRFELLHLPLSAAGRLVLVFRSVVEPIVLAMLDAGHDLSFGRAVARQLQVGARGFEELAIGRADPSKNSPNVMASGVRLSYQNACRAADGPNYQWRGSYVEAGATAFVERYG